MKETTTLMERLHFAGVLLLAAYICSVVVASTDGADDLLIRQVVPEDNADHHFSLFKQKYGKAYSTQQEHDYRLSVFKSNLRRAKRYQLIDPSAVHGVTKFSDLTPAEFERTYLGLKRGGLKLPEDAQKAPILPTIELPGKVDWRESGAVTGVKDQGVCESYWAFTTAAALEGAHFLSNGELLNLSAQQLVDCDKECDNGVCDDGCNGGRVNTAFEYTLKAGGLVREKDYPYTAINGTCKFDKSKVAASVANFSVITIDEDQISANLVKNGPLAAGINAAGMQSYMGGVSCPLRCILRHRDHAMLLVGYSLGFSSSALSAASVELLDYWILKNSWGENWGENGYYRICRGLPYKNVCGVDSLVSTVTAVHKK